MIDLSIGVSGWMNWMIFCHFDVGRSNMYFNTIVEIGLK